MIWRKPCLTLLLTAAFFGILNVPAGSHHSLSAEFDLTKRIELIGTVTKVEWTNPHAWFYVTVKDSGKVVEWAVQLNSPNALARMGWTRSSLKIGETVTVHAMMSIDSWRRAYAREVWLSTGEKILG